MDCRTALEILEVARPGSGDLADPELAEAAAHIESHADCRNEFLLRQKLDREIGAAMRDVPVPHDLKTRLLAELAECPESSDRAETVTVAVAAVESKTALQRRTWMRLVVGAAACVIAGVICWQKLPADPEQIDIAGLPDQFEKSIADENLNFDELKKFDDNYTQEWPVTWEFPGLTHAGPKSYRPASQPDLAIAMYQFRFKYRSAPVTGYLLVLPANLVNQDQLPAGKSLSYAGAVIRTRMTSQSWTNGDFVYICVVPGGHDNFRALVRLLHPGFA